MLQREEVAFRHGVVCLEVNWLYYSCRFEMCAAMPLSRSHACCHDVFY